MKTDRRTVRDLVDEQADMNPDQTFLMADGFDDALLGLDIQHGRTVYSVRRCLEILVQQGMTEEEAVEYFEFNTRGAYVGPSTPIWCDDEFLSEMDDEDRSTAETPSLPETDEGDFSVGSR